MSISEILSVASRIVEIVLTAAVGFAGGYLALRGKLRESEAMVQTAVITNEDDMLLAFKELQTDWAKTYQQLLKDVNEPLDKARAEINLLRISLNKANEEIALLNSRIEDLEKSLQTEKRRVLDLRRRLQIIRDEIDTGPLHDSGVHKVPKKDDQ